MKILKGFLTFILKLGLFLSFLGILVLIPIANAFSKKEIRNMVTDINLEDEAIQDTMDEILEPIYDKTRTIGIKDDVIVKIINSEEVKGLVGDITSNLVDYAFTGHNQKLITTDNIESLVSKAIDRVNESGYYEIDGIKKEEIISIVGNEVDNYQEIVPDTSFLDANLDMETKNALEIIRFIIGGNLLTVLIVSIVISMIGLVLLKRKDWRFVKTIASTIMVASIMALIIYIILAISNSYIFKADIFYVYKIINSITIKGIVLASIITVLMIGILISYKLLSKKDKKEER